MILLQHLPEKATETWEFQEKGRGLGEILEKVFRSRRVQGLGAEGLVFKGLGFRGLGVQGFRGLGV